MKLEETACEDVLHRQLNLGTKSTKGNVEALDDLVILGEPRVTDTVLGERKLLESLAELAVILGRRLGAWCRGSLKGGKTSEVAGVDTELESARGRRTAESVVERLVLLFGSRSRVNSRQAGSTGSRGSPRGDTVPDSRGELGERLLDLGLLRPKQQSGRNGDKRVSRVHTSQGMSDWYLRGSRSSRSRRPWRSSRDQCGHP